MGKDRQEKKLKSKKKVESDRDQSLHYPGAARFEKEGEAGKSIDE
ncbi:YpzI family protein [Bacillus aerolatus]|uniref:YpzI family protein n=1 Tax=Bacillus aerolatus TaxID=2653354 RepID=A0A6I1FFK4_9BACI|nr:YpzI family protein [Bacillus aerolatus]KAB7704069.1 YpzI family protein [Bacillus aerolatus]